MVQNFFADDREQRVCKIQVEAHGTDLRHGDKYAAFRKQVAFFNPEKAEQLQKMMKTIINGNTSFMGEVPVKKIEEPMAKDWDTLFAILTHNKPTKNAKLI